MARSRNIKPAFFINHILAKLQPLTRLLFIGLWTVVDREGRVEDIPEKIKIQVMPYDECNVNDHLTSLHNAGFIIRYSYDNNQYIQIVNFTKHQNPHKKEAPSTILAPDKHHTSNDLNRNEPCLNPLIDSLNPLTRVPDKSGAATKGKKKKKDPVVYTADFEELWEIWKPYDMGKGNKEPALEKYQESLSFVEHASLLQAAKSYCADCDQRRSKTQHLATWLYQKGWEAQAKTIRPQTPLPPPVYHTYGDEA